MWLVHPIYLIPKLQKKISETLIANTSGSIIKVQGYKRLRHIPFDGATNITREL